MLAIFMCVLEIELRKCVLCIEKGGTFSKRYYCLFLIYFMHMDGMTEIRTGLAFEDHLHSFQTIIITRRLRTCVYLKSRKN